MSAMNLGDSAVFLTTGSLDINGLATANPGIGGRVWNDGGTLKIA